MREYGQRLKRQVVDLPKLQAVDLISCLCPKTVPFPTPPLGVAGPLLSFGHLSSVAGVRRRMLVSKWLPFWSSDSTYGLPKGPLPKSWLTTHVSKSPLLRLMANMQGGCRMTLRRRLIRSPFNLHCRSCARGALTTVCFAPWRPFTVKVLNFSAWTVIAARPRPVAGLSAQHVSAD